MFGKILVLSPHRDDEVLGMGGTLLQHGKKIHIFYFNKTHPNVDQYVYDIEAERVAKQLNASVSYSNFPRVNRLDTVPISEYITELEKLINKYKPKSIFIPCPDYNQDHRVVYNAAMTALRTHDKNWYVKNVYLYEQPETHTPAYTTFTPHLFVPIDIDWKIDLYLMYASQVREHRSTWHLRMMAGMRGMQCNQEYAEAFQIIRETKK